MTIHGTGFMFFCSLALLFGVLCGWSLERENGNTPAAIPVIIAAIGGLFSLITLIGRGL